MAARLVVPARWAPMMKASGGNGIVCSGGAVGSLGNRPLVVQSDTASEVSPDFRIQPLEARLCLRDAKSCAHGEGGAGVAWIDDVPAFVEFQPVRIGVMQVLPGLV